MYSNASHLYLLLHTCTDCGFSWAPSDSPWKFTLYSVSLWQGVKSTAYESSVQYMYRYRHVNLSLRMISVDLDQIPRVRVGVRTKLYFECKHMHTCIFIPLHVAGNDYHRITYTTCCSKADINNVRTPSSKFCEYNHLKQAKKSVRPTGHELMRLRR
jgi:hypothetical protein